jgi:hypothetical protein
MSSDELHMHLDRFLDFDIDQALAMGSHHEAYLLEFRALREGRIAEFLKSAREINSSGGMPDIQKVRKFVDQQATLETSIRKLDDRLFNQVAQLFPEASVFEIERARNSRARIRARTGINGQMGGTMTTQDLWMVVDQLELTAEQRQAFSQALLPWEDRGTVLSKQAAKAGSSMMIKMVEKFDELGFIGDEFDDLDYSNPEQAQKLQQLMMTIQQVFVEVQQESGEAIAQVRRLNSRTARDLDQVIDPWLARSFKDEYLNQSGFAGISMFTLQSAEQVRDFDFEVPGNFFIYEGEKAFKRNPIAFIEYFKTLELIDSEDREAMASLFQAYLQNDIDLQDDSIKLFETFDPTMMGLEMGTVMSGGASMEELQAAETPMMKLVREIGEASDQRKKLRQDLVSDLAQLLEVRSDVKLEQTLLDELRALEHAVDPANGMRSVFGISSPIPVLEASVSRSRPWVVDPIDQAVVKRLVEQLGEDAWLEPVIETMHQDYLANWQDRVAPVIESYEGAKNELYSSAIGMGPNGSSVSIPEVLPTDVSTRLRTAIEATRAADMELFDSLSATATDRLTPMIDLERNARLIDIALGGAGQQGGWWEGPSSTLGQSVNLLEVLKTLDLTPEQLAKLIRGLDSELDSLIAARRALQGGWIERTQAEQQNQYDYLATQANSDDPNSIDVLPNRPEPLSQEMKGLSEAASTSEAAFRARALELLPAESHEAFRGSVRIATHPVIYGYDDDIESTFELIDRMTSLQADQLATLEVIRSEFAQHWCSSGDRLVDCMDRMKLPSQLQLSNQDGWQDHMEASMEQEQLSFERREYAVQRLRLIASVLDAEQRERIPALRKLASQVPHSGSNQRRVDVPVDQP